MRVRPALRPRTSQSARPVRRSGAADAFAHYAGLLGHKISGLSHTAHAFAVYASQAGLPRRHARLASGWWPAFARQDWLPAGVHVRRFPCVPSFPVSPLHFLLLQASPGARTPFAATDHSHTGGRGGEARGAIASDMTPASFVTVAGGVALAAQRAPQEDRGVARAALTVVAICAARDTARTVSSQARAVGAGRTAATGSRRCARRDNHPGSARRQEASCRPGRLRRPHPRSVAKDPAEDKEGSQIDEQRRTQSWPVEEV